jgi:cation:H+ antiporter
MINVLYLICGLVAILFGANALTDGAASIAKRFNVSSLVIGLTIVAFGTSMPEFVTSLFSSLKGSADLAIGNIVGSNIFNALFILGCTAVVAPIKIGKGTLTREIPFVLLASLILFVIISDKLVDGSDMNMLSRSDGLVLLGFFVIFLAYTFAIAHEGADDDAVVKEMPVAKSAILIVLGLAGLIAGGSFFVDGASGIARMLGVSESIIGLTIVAGGTSLPELATSVTAALKKNAGIAIGNVVGSNLFNIFFILGTSATITPMNAGGMTNIDMFTLVLSSVLMWFFGYFYKVRTISRPEGILLIAAYVAYIIVII